MKLCNVVSWLMCFWNFLLVAVGEIRIECHSERRTCLPAPCPNTSNISLWNILRNNIGKDLSKVAMPVELNEPLNTLQRLCEELEYSELLDKAAHTPDPFERMVNIIFFKYWTTLDLINKLCDAKIVCPRDESTYPVLSLCPYPKGVGLQNLIYLVII